MNKVSVIIPSYNRFEELLNAITSIKKQTYKNIEIIVVNDKSSQKEYYNYDWAKENIKIIHLNKNTRSIFGYPCAGYVRNLGIKIADGKYIAFCDDDDIWFPKKIELQLEAMKKTGCKMSSTDGLIGIGIYNSKKSYQKFNAECNLETIKNKFKKIGSKIMNNGFPNIWDYKFLKIHNCIACSSVLIEKEILNKINNMKNLRNGLEDYNCWLRCLKFTNNVYLKDICFYYNGQNYA
jgi:teichuronic acid biosynthesis glycosyltransferase TuaG